MAPLALRLSRALEPTALLRITGLRPLFPFALAAQQPPLCVGVAALLKGTKITLREATEADRRSVFEWLARSDLTPSMMGPPLFPDHSIPTWEEFCADYQPHYFDSSPPCHGRCFIILESGIAVGIICHNELLPDGTTDMDIWLKSEVLLARTMSAFFDK
jgi:hypothetical protein